MLTYKFCFKSQRAGEDCVFLRLSNNSVHRFLNTGVKCSAEELTKILAGRPSPNHVKYQRYFKSLTDLVESIKIDLAIEGRRDEDVRIILSMVKAELNRNVSVEGSSGNFMLFYKQHIEKYDKRSTLESFEYTLSTILKFDPNAGNLNFENIKYAWLSDFETWMKKQGLSQNTRKIHFGNIRTVMREAYKRELTECEPFRRFTFKAAKTIKRSLMVEELRDLFTCKVIPQTEYFRDMFKLMFYLMGINTIDLYNLQSVTKDGRVEFLRSKTSGIFSIKLEPEAMEIITRHKGQKNLLDIADRWRDHRSFRHQLNKAISRIGIARGKGIKDSDEQGNFAQVTSYWARHTWASIAAELDIPDATIAMALGHSTSDNRVTQTYIRRNFRKVDEANRRVLDYVLYGVR